MKKVDQGKAETAAEIYSNIKMKTMVAITASFFGLMVFDFIIKVRQYLDFNVLY